MFSDGRGKRVGVAIGDFVLDLEKMYQQNLFQSIVDQNVFRSNYLNDYIALGKEKTSLIRSLIQQQLCNEESILKEQFDQYFLHQKEVVMFLPIQIGDYTDFYSSRYHAENVGSLFRDPENALPPNWLSMPIAYHGRSSSIVVSGTSIMRPMGQSFANKENELKHQTTAFLDFELEMATIIGKSNPMGTPINCTEAEEYIFGYALFNDWSARDLQKWEYQPLGPFTSKNFASTLSPWIVTSDALEPFKKRVTSQQNILNYLHSDQLYTYDIHLQVELNNNLITQTNFSNLYWTPTQQIAHHTVNGCNLQVGDVLASGTISGPEEKGKGCLLEMTDGGENPLILKNNEIRTFLRIGDEIKLSAYCEKNGVRLGFGENIGTIKKNRHD